MDLREGLVEAVTRKQAVIVAGAGLSAALSPRFPGVSWKRLVRDGADYASKREKDSIFENQLKSIVSVLDDDTNEINEDSLIAYATAVKASLKKHGKQAYADFLNDVFSSAQAEYPELAELIESLECPIATTNYDTLIESALGWKNAPTLVGDSDAALRIFRSEERGVVHLHGVWSNPDSVVFSQQDYEEFTKNQKSLNLRNAAYAMKSFIFIGQGSGVMDPGFTQLKQQWAEMFESSRHYHYLLCRDADMDYFTKELAGTTIRPVSYGQEHADLPKFIKEVEKQSKVARPAVSIETLANDLIGLIGEEIRDKSLAHPRIISTVDAPQLIVDPIFIPKHHELYSYERQKQIASADQEQDDQYISVERLIKPGKIWIVVGEENSGLTTALYWLALKSIEESRRILPITVDYRNYSKKRRLNALIGNRIREAEYPMKNKDDVPEFTLVVDSFSLDSSSLADRFMGDMKSLENMRNAFIGCRLGNEWDIFEKFQNSEFDVNNVEVAYLGKPGKTDVVKYAELVSPDLPIGRSDQALSVIRREHLARNPFNLSLVLRLVSDKSTNSDGLNSPAKLVSKFIELMLSTLGEGLDSRETLVYENVALILEKLAEVMVEKQTASLSYSQAMRIFENVFEEYEWGEDASRWVDLLVDMRILMKSGNTISFRQSSFLFFFAANGAEKSDGFKRILYLEPLKYAPIIKMMASISRRDREGLERVTALLDDWDTYVPCGRIYKPAVSFGLEALENGEPGENDGLWDGQDAEAEKGDDVDYRYDTSSDRDVEPFPLRPVGEAPESYRLFITLDLASTVLRETDEIEVRGLKDESFRRILKGWGSLLDILERDEEFKERSRSKLLEVGSSYSISEERVDELIEQFNPLYCAFIVLSGVDGSLRSKKLAGGARRVSESLKQNQDEPLISAGLTLFQMTDYSRGWSNRIGDSSSNMQDTWFFVNFVSEVVMSFYVFGGPVSNEEEMRVKEIIRAKIVNGHASPKSINVGATVDNMISMLKKRRAGRDVFIKKFERRGLI
ncbi:SIR2 family NAD-dependent protein deacylase [Kocuria palustris]|uniref:SIR2 family NAD-dependent protein deacylase n=1 Tax=Kocuria palustris TaxID=71999 RepID=UPI0009EA9D6E|nr:SIR2 family protein [Kocuria palustris]